VESKGDQKNEVDKEAESCIILSFCLFVKYLEEVESKGDQKNEVEKEVESCIILSFCLFVKYLEEVKSKGEQKNEVEKEVESCIRGGSLCFLPCFLLRLLLLMQASLLLRHLISGAF